MKSPIIIGIDPGVTGAIAAIQGGDVLLLDDAPVHRIGTRRQPRALEMWKILSRLAVEHGDTEIRACIEEQTANARTRVRNGRRQVVKQGARGMLNLGRGFGMWEMAVIAAGIPYEIVSPQDWKRAMVRGLPGRDKGASRLVAERIFPKADLGTRKDNGRAEALLIAEYGRTRFFGDHKGE